MMTKKDYERAAKVVHAAFTHYQVLAEHHNKFVGEHGSARGAAEHAKACAIRDAFVVFFEGDNPRFDRATFLAACTGQKRPSVASRRR